MGGARPVLDRDEVTVHRIPVERGRSRRCRRRRRSYELPTRVWLHPSKRPGEADAPFACTAPVVDAGLSDAVASHGYIMEQGKVVLDGSASELRDNEDIKEFYLGGAGDQRKSFKNLKSFKRRERWL
jgi:hypothetical protein